MLRKIIFVVTVALVLSEKVTFNNFKIFRIIPYNDDQLEVLKQLGKLGNVVSKNQLDRTLLYVNINNTHLYSIFDLVNHHDCM